MYSESECIRVAFNDVPAWVCVYTVFYKKTTPYLIAHNFGIMLTDFRNFFTLGLSSDCIMN